MTIISPDEYDLLMSLSGYELNLQATNIGNKYGLSANQVIGMLPNQPPHQQHSHQRGNSPHRLTRIFQFSQTIALSMTQAQMHHKEGSK